MGVTANPKKEDPHPPTMTDVGQDLWKRFAERPTTLLRPDLGIHPEELLERLKDPSYPPEDLARTLVGLIGDITIRIQPYQNGPFRGIEEVALDDPRLADVAAALLETLATRVLPEAALKSMTKTSAVRHPGG